VKSLGCIINSRQLCQVVTRVHTKQWTWVQVLTLESEKKVKVTLRLTVGRLVSVSWCRAPSASHDQTFLTVCRLLSCLYGASSLTRGRVCTLYKFNIQSSAVSPGSVQQLMSSRYHGSLDTWKVVHVTDAKFRHLISQSQSYITIDSQSASLSWWQAPIWDPRPIFLFSFNYF
jgi:hypothetical protein